MVGVTATSGVIPPRLSRSALARLPASVQRPGYALEGTRIGIVHLGPGAFHRAHVAAYVDDLLAGDPAWGIAAVSLHNPRVRDALGPQDWLYTLAVMDEPLRLRVIGALREVLCAPEQPAQVLARLADPAVRLVTLTVTEKGYALAGGELDLANREIAHDLAAPESPQSVVGYLTAGLGLRRARGVPPCTLLSCDNLADNGHRLRTAVLQFARRIDQGLAAWIEERVAFPCSMVDSITPQTDAALRARVAEGLGCVDAWPVQREPYRQWVIEDRFCNARPAFEAAGAIVTADVAAYERAKLYLLNGAHSALAYLGLLLGLDTVASGMADPVLGGFVERLMRDAIAPVIAMPAGVDRAGYIDAILARFRNRNVHHQLAQIAWDGSQKLPVRLLGTLDEALQAGRPVACLALVIAAWMHFTRRQARAGVAIVDPLADELVAIAARCIGDPDDDVRAFLGLERVFGARRNVPALTAALVTAYRALADGSPASVAQALGHAGRGA
jgi:fructuronate reductase